MAKRQRAIDPDLANCWLVRKQMKVDLDCEIQTGGDIRHWRHFLVEQHMQHEIRYELCMRDIRKVFARGLQLFAFEFTGVTPDNPEGVIWL
jgi:hypothetical protein